MKLLSSCHKSSWHWYCLPQRSCGLLTDRTERKDRILEFSLDSVCFGTVFCQFWKTTYDSAQLNHTTAHYKETLGFSWGIEAPEVWLDSLRQKPSAGSASRRVTTTAVAMAEVTWTIAKMLCNEFESEVLCNGFDLEANIKCVLMWMMF